MRVGSELNIHISMLAATWFRTCPGKSEVDAASCGPGCVPQRCAREVRRRHLFLCNNRCRSHTVARVAPAVVQTNLLVPQLQLLTHSLTHSPFQWVSLAFLVPSGSWATVLLVSTSTTYTTVYATCERANLFRHLLRGQLHG